MSTLQIMFSHGVPEKLQKVRDAINVCMARILGRAVKKLPQVVEPEEDMNEVSHSTALSLIFGSCLMT